MQSPQYIGVYSLRNKLQGGSKALYFVWQTEVGDYIVQRIDSARKPVGVPERVAHDVLLHNFVPEAPPHTAARHAAGRCDPFFRRPAPAGAAGNGCPPPAGGNRSSS